MSAKRKRVRKKTPAATGVTQPLHPFELYRPGRLAQLFHVDPTTIWRWQRDGTLPPFVQIAGIKGLIPRATVPFRDSQEPVDSLRPLGR
jgi:hypothetical protein